ncbi:MAG: hydrogenase 4 subunit F [Alphaproteobacteria bacterium]|nr:MAG: hydrogenase 4 subunit F [Alphaproteobacteria bacterium]
MTVAGFNAVELVLLVPAVSAALLAILPGFRITAWLNTLAALLTLLAALSLFGAERPAPGNYLLVDDLNIVFIVLNTFVGFTAASFSASYIGHEIETGRLTPVYVRFYHAMYQLMMFGMNLALVSNNIGLMWVAIELATLTTVLMVGVYRTPEALEAAWKYFILGSVGIALALFGTILVYVVAQPVLGEGTAAMVWTNLIARAGEFDPALLNLAFVFLLLGYGTKVGLAPLHAWLPDAHAEGPTPISAVLSGLLLNVALYAVLRFKLLMAAHPEALAPGPLMVGMGLLSLVFAAFMLYRRRDIKRLFAYSSIEHMGIIVFAFGMGGTLANFAGLLHMVMHSLTKSAIFFSVGHVAQIKGTQKVAEIRGLTQSHPLLGWGLAIGVLAIAGLPPFGVFMSEFLVVTSTFARNPVLALVLVFGLLVAFGALLLRLTGFLFGEPTGELKPARASLLPLYAHMALVLIAGLYMPGPMVDWFRAVAKLLG